MSSRRSSRYGKRILVAMLWAYGGVSGWSMRVKGICARDYIKMIVLKGMV